MIIGGYNNLQRIHIEDSSNVLVRRPSVSQAQFPQEETLTEVATAKYIRQNTKVPTPRVFFYRDGSDVGPFMIIERVEHKSTLSHAITVLGLDLSITHSLNPNIPQSKLYDLYFKVAKIILKLFSHKFNCIGFLCEAEDGSFSITKRSLTQNMNDMLQLANIPSAILPPEGRNV